MDRQIYEIFIDGEKMDRQMDISNIYRWRKDGQIDGYMKYLQMEKRRIDRWIYEIFIDGKIDG